MRYLYSEYAGGDTIKLISDEYHYLAKVRRVKVSERVFLRNLKDNYLYIYKILRIDRKSILLKLIEKRESIALSKRKLHIGWCVIDTKNIQKSLPYLNEIGVDRVTFIYCQRTQKSYKINMERLHKILISSSQQCGRSTIMKLDTSKNLHHFLEDNPNAYLLDFGGKKIDSSMSLESIVVGAEGGFSQVERELFKERLVGFDTELTLQSHSAVVSVASILLLS
jgi:16S rRNA (uracil1498-N3)-methyltransferase